ncbi:hypothetical protein [Rhizobium herbae]
MAKIEDLKSIEELLFSAPLYKQFQIPADLELMAVLCGRSHDSHKFDAHCPYCGKQTTWTLSGTLSVPGGDPWRDIAKRHAHDTLRVSCGRDKLHVIRFSIYLKNMTIEKTGQYPSIATVVNDELSHYRKYMTSADANEFYKATGLAAHGVGVGSFVYLRRVFERLVFGRFNEFKDQEGWKDEDFSKLRMSERIAFLRGHLPSFLVEHAGIYGILSVGIHELSEEVCLSHFEVLKQSIVLILEEDMKKREELALKKKFSDALKSIEI